MSAFWNRRFERELAAARRDLEDLTRATADALTALTAHLAAVEDRLQVLAGRLDAEPAQAAAEDQAPAASAPDDPPAGTAGPAGRAGRASHDGVTATQRALLDAVAELGEASTGEIAAHIGRPGEAVQTHDCGFQVPAESVEAAA